ncbi:unnamed protein product, partial [marine sediment metagenome]
ADFLDNATFDTEIEIEIWTGLIDAGTLYWKGLFSISDTKDNFQNTVAILNPFRINDVYRPVLEQAERQIEIDALHNILEQVRVGYSEPLVIDNVWDNPAAGYNAFDTLDALAGNVMTAIEADTLAGDAVSVDLPALEDNDIVIIDVAGWTQVGGLRPLFDIEFGGGAASATDEGFKNITTGLMCYTMDVTDAGPRLVLKAFQAPMGNLSIRDLTFTARKITAANDRTSAGQLLMTFLNNFISSAIYMGVVALSGNVVSTFFANDPMPTVGAPSTIDAWIGTNGAGNYVTETLDNELNAAIIGLLREWFDVNAIVSFKLSFNDIMGQLREMFQVYWFIDGDGKFRVEHEMYFVALVTDSTPIVLSGSSEVEGRIQA